jgi:hypothetical protein
MKRYILILGTMMAGLSLTSCLEEYPKGQIEEDEVYMSASEIERDLVGDLYNHIGGSSPSEGLQGTIRGVYDWNTVSTDEMLMPVRGADWNDGGFWNRLYNHKWTSSENELKATWDYLYKVIALCNRSLYLLFQHRTLLTDEQYKYYQAEVRGLRAMFYFYTMDMFGRIPLVTDYKITVDEITQSERSEVFYFIVSELQEVAPILIDERSNYLGNYYGRFTRPVAYFILAKLMLNAEIYTDDDWTDGKRPDGSKIYFDVDGYTLNAWEATQTYCAKISEMGLSYALEEDYEMNFIVHNETSCENIFVIPMDNTLYNNRFNYIFRSIHSAHGGAIGMAAENGPCATISTMNAYGITEDNPKDRDGKKIDFRYFVNFHSDTVYVKGSMVDDGYGNVLVYHPLEVAEDLTGSVYERNGGARMAKYQTDFTAYEDGTLQNNDIVLFRFADVLLMNAEAKVRNGESGQYEMDKIRARSYASPRECTLDNLLTERLLELMWEGWRRNDLIRFGQFTWYYDNRKDAITDNVGYTTVFPIPKDVLELNPNFEQNPGY